VSRRLKILAALTAGALALGGAVADARKPAASPKPTASPCPVPTSGFQSCLRVLYTTGEDAAVEDVRMTATLLRRVDRCPGRSGARRVTITAEAGTRLDRARRPGHCRRGVITWRAAFSPGETAGWELRQGDTVHATWSGVRNDSSVQISGEG
jgi:hypothetical protein